MANICLDNQPRSMYGRRRTLRHAVRAVHKGWTLSLSVQLHATVVTKSHGRHALATAEIFIVDTECRTNFRTGRITLFLKSEILEFRLSVGTVIVCSLSASLQTIMFLSLSDS